MAHRREKYRLPQDELTDPLLQPSPASAHYPAKGLLCASCKTLFNGELGSHAQAFPHHELVSSLYQGRDLGCRVCTLIWDRTTEKQREYMNRKLGESFALSSTHHYYGHMTRDNVYKHFRVIILVFENSELVDPIRIDLALEPWKTHRLKPFNLLKRGTPDAVRTTQAVADGGLRSTTPPVDWLTSDSVSDWQQESARMGSIYLHSACNIAATSAVDSTEGCLFQRAEPSADELWKVQAGPWASNKTYVILDLHKLAAQVQDAPLSSRGWVVQERILSPRMLHMGRSQIFWECDEGLACEFWPNAIPKAFEDIFGCVFRNMQKELLELRLTYSKPTPTYTHWYDVVDRYTNCYLTESDDKLVAISGIAKLFQRSLPGDTYVAGLWKKDLAHGLLWSSAKEKPAPLVRVSGRAPTWSWASVDGSIRGNGRRYVMTNEAILIQIISASTKLVTADPTGQVTQGEVKLIGMLFECNFENDHPQLGTPGGTFKPITPSIIASEIRGFLRPDSERSTVFASRTFFCLPVHELIWRGAEHFLQGLMLMPVGGSNKVFTRIGYWHICVSEVKKHSRVFGIIVDPFGEIGKIDPTVRLRTLVLV